ncbi:MAG: hypothetical protein A2Y14_01230 [Verrucomicrobia bacterium GWF2_51_19]|nr:MAG: hypothetical protein A2Y14_01230 [Verrucomicrobia bacterium GWF2_51_19]HCJ11508.1 methylmalonyl-CoA epimerase [Opitutae bacterium]
MMYTLHHIGYLTGDIQSTARDFCQRFGYAIESEVVEDKAQTAFVQFLILPPHRIELISPNGSGKLTNALQKKVTLHHLCYEVDDINAALREQRPYALPISSPTPAPAFSGNKIAWLMDANGFLIELVERA